MLIRRFAAALQLVLFAGIVCASALSGAAHAATAASAPSAGQAGGLEATIRRTLEERMSGIRIAGVTRTEFGGLYEVRTADNEIFYTDEKVSFIFVGAIRDGRNPRRNLTEERLETLSAIKYGDLPFDNSFTIVRGSGKRHVAYFSDPNCPYCKQLEKELLKVDDITIHVFLYPILTADSAPKARAIWCSEDRGKTWIDWMVNGVAPSSDGSCDTASVDKNLAVGRKIRVTSVPTLVFPNGTRVAGFRPAPALEKMLDDSANLASAAGK